MLRLVKKDMGLFGGILGGIGGAFAGGPMGAGIGYGLGSSLPFKKGGRVKRSKSGRFVKRRK